MLHIDNINVYYGAIHALKGISVDVTEGEIVTLIGANGAGKSTILRTISGLLRPKSGTILFEGKNLAVMAAQDIVKLGLSQVPEGRRVFANMTVLENLELGAYTRSDKAGIAADLDKIFKRFPRLLERKAQLAGTLSGGEQQMLAMARILRTGANILLLDEITEGLAPVIVKKLGEVLTKLKQRNLTILLVEQNFRFAAPIADRHYVMEHGHIVEEVKQTELEEKSGLLNTYLGV